MARALCIAAAGLVAVLAASYVSVVTLAWLLEDDLTEAEQAWRQIGSN